MSRLRIDTGNTDKTRELDRVKEGETLDVDYGELTSGDATFRKKGTLQLAVRTARRSGNARTLVCQDQYRRRVVVTYYKGYKTAYVEIPD